VSSQEAQEHVASEEEIWALKRVSIEIRRGNWGLHLNRQRPGLAGTATGGDHFAGNRHSLSSVCVHRHAAVVDPD
jgi:hypothetical protein